MIKQNLKIKLTTIISSSSSLILVLVSMLFGVFPCFDSILTFERNEMNLGGKIIQVNMIMFYFLLTSLAVRMIYLIYSIIKGHEKDLMKILYLDLGWTFTFMHVFLCFPFLTGLIFKTTYNSFVLSILFEVVIIGLICECYKKTKSKMNLSFCSFINMSMYSSVLFSLITFIVLFNFSEMAALCFDHTLPDFESIKQTIFICAVTFYSISAIILLTYFKDVFLFFYPCFCICFNLVIVSH